MMHSVEIRHYPPQNFQMGQSSAKLRSSLADGFPFWIFPKIHRSIDPVASGALRKFLDSTTRPLLTLRCHGSHAAAPPRYSSFTLWNWVVQAQGFRNMKQHLGLVVIRHF